MIRALGKSILRCLAPSILIEHHRRKFRLRSFGIPDSMARGVSRCRQVEEAIQGCCYDLWSRYVDTTPEDWVLVDVGANEGQFLRAALTLVSRAKVVAFEPLPECQPYLREVLKEQAGARVIAAAVGASSGRATLRRFGPTMSSLLGLRKEIAGYYPAVHEADRIDVPTVTLDDVLADVGDIGLLKIDAQGYDLEVLKGGRQCLQRTQAVLVEINYITHYDHEPEFNDVHTFMTQGGFRLCGVSPPCVVDQTPLWANALYSKKSLA